jgi:hypothetical protein
MTKLVMAMVEEGIKMTKKSAILFHQTPRTSPL